MLRDAMAVVIAGALFHIARPNSSGLRRAPFSVRDGPRCRPFPPPAWHCTHCFSAKSVTAGAGVAGHDEHPSPAAAPVRGREIGDEIAKLTGVERRPLYALRLHGVAPI
jgi:hypothetical protein